MAKLKMQKILICGLNSERKAVLEELQKKEIVEICAPDGGGAAVGDTARSIAQFERYMQSAESALAALNQYVPAKSALIPSRRNMPLSGYHMEQDRRDEIMRHISRIADLSEKINDRISAMARSAAAKGTQAPSGDAAEQQDPELAGHISEIRECNKYRSDIELFYDHIRMRKDKYLVLAKTGVTEYTFSIEGFIPEKRAAELKSLLEDNYTAYVEIEEPGDAEEVPVAFSNNAFTAPVEGITATYSMPSRTDIDPNPIMAFFYYLFFGLMFSDAGYGLLLMIACGYLGFGNALEKPKRGNYRMFFFCGISTTCWGLLFGGFFGNIVYTVSSTFFGREFSLNPIWLDPISRAMDLLIFSVGLGITQILIGMGIKFYMLCRQGKVLDAICDVGFWMAVLLGICGLAAGLGLKAPGFTEAGTWIALGGLAGLLITGGRKQKKIVGKVFGGVAKLYDITGYVSDALSYCRLMALGLATGAIANVFNMLGAMAGGSIIGLAMFIVIAAVGHVLNFAMNMLGAYVHTNRLQYVEFFSKFYEGGGRKFEPFRMDTKYCYFSQDNKEARSDP